MKAQTIRQNHKGPLGREKNGQFQTQKHWSHMTLSESSPFESYFAGALEGCQGRTLRVLKKCHTMGQLQAFHFQPWPSSVTWTFPSKLPIYLPLSSYIWISGDHSCNGKCQHMSAPAPHEQENMTLQYLAQGLRLWISHTNKPSSTVCMSGEEFCGGMDLKLRHISTCTDCCGQVPLPQHKIPEKWHHVISEYIRYQISIKI